MIRTANSESHIIAGGGALIRMSFNEKQIVRMLFEIVGDFMDHFHIGLVAQNMFICRKVDSLDLQVQSGSIELVQIGYAAGSRNTARLRNRPVSVHRNSS